jgi:hypothetical protein
MLAWLGLSIYRGVVHVAKTSAYWTKDTAVPLFERVMTAKRFMWINAVWHITDTDVEDKAKADGVKLDWLWHLQPLIDTVQAACYELYRMGEWVTVDEQRIAYLGRHHAVTYNSRKPIKWGFTIHMAACALNSFIHSFLVYEGKTEGTVVEGLAQIIVMKLVARLLNTGRTVVGDRWFTSLELIKQLRAAATTYIGTLRRNAAGFPASLFRYGTRKSPLARGQYVHKYNGDVTATAWRDRKTVFLVSSTHDATAPATVQRWVDAQKKRVPLAAPKAAKDYGANKSGVDRANRLSSSYMPGSQTKRWWVALAWGIINIAMHNAYVIYRLQCLARGETPITNMQFRLRLALQLIDSWVRRNAKLPTTPAHMSHTGCAHELMPHGERRCRICYAQGRTKRSSYWCQICKTPVCASPCYDIHQGTKRPAATCK